MLIFLYSSPQNKIHYMINLSPLFWLVAGKFFLQYKNNIRDIILFNYSVFQQKKLWFFFFSNGHLLIVCPCNCATVSLLLSSSIPFICACKTISSHLFSWIILCCSVYGRMKITANWIDFWIFVKLCKCLHVKPVPFLLE